MFKYFMQLETKIFEALISKHLKYNNLKLNKNYRSGGPVDLGIDAWTFLEFFICLLVCVVAMP